MKDCINDLALEYEVQMVGQALNKKKKGKEGAFLSTQASPMPGFSSFSLRNLEPPSLSLCFSANTQPPAPKMPSIFTQSNSQFLTYDVPNIKQTNY